MNCNYFVSETTPNNIDLYLRCFSQNIFCEDYGISIASTELNSKVSEIALMPYKDVRRFVLCYKNIPISFCHFLSKDNIATVSGGILPELTNTGKGVYAAAIFYDFYFNKFSAEALIAEINKDNIRSQRMHKAFGFVEILNADKRILKLSVETFPNTFAKQILSKLKYEYK